MKQGTARRTPNASVAKEDRQEHVEHALLRILRADSRPPSYCPPTEALVAPLEVDVQLDVLDWPDTRRWSQPEWMRQWNQ